MLVSENIVFDLDDLDSYVRATYPDLRKCLNQLQVNSSTGTLLSSQSQGSGEDELLVEATNLFKAGKILRVDNNYYNILHYIPHVLKIHIHGCIRI